MPTVEQRGPLIRNRCDKTLARAVSEASMFLDILTWVQCFSLYIAVMAVKRHDLVTSMTSHMQTVMRYKLCMGACHGFSTIGRHGGR